MIKLIFTLTLASISFFSGEVDIKTINEYKKKAESAFNQKDYVAAANYYNTLIDSFGVEEPELKLNLAHSYYNASQNDLAEKAYHKIISTDNNYVSSLANRQLGAMNLDKKKYKEALNYFKEALKKNPNDYENQYNYELVKKLIKEEEEKKEKENKDNKDQKDQDKKDEQKKDQKKQDQQNQEKKDQQNQQKEKQDQKKEGQDQQDKKENQDKKEEEKKGQDSEKKKGEEKDEKKENLEKKDKSEDEKNKEKDKKNAQQKQEQRLQKINMSAAKAKMILDAMKNNETKYYQQLKRKSVKKKDRSKPDW